MNNRIESLQVIRALAFLGVFASHSEIMAFSASGAWGVSVFFILSGFLMFYSYSGTNKIQSYNFFGCIKFGIKKISALFPLHVVMIAVALPPLILHYLGYGEGKDFVVNPIVKIVVNLFLIQSWIPIDEVYFSLNSVSWYLSVSLFLYIMFPVILYKMNKYRGGRDGQLLLLL